MSECYEIMGTFQTPGKGLRSQVANEWYFRCNR